VLVVPVIVGAAAAGWALTFAGYSLDDVWTFVWTVAVPYALGTALLLGRSICSVAPSGGAGIECPCSLSLAARASRAF